VEPEQREGYRHTNTATLAREVSMLRKAYVDLQGKIDEGRQQSGGRGRGGGGDSFSRDSRDGTIERVRVQPYAEYGAHATRHLEEGVNGDISPPWGQHTYKSLALVPSMLEPGSQPTGSPAWQPSQHYATPHAGADVCVSFCLSVRPSVLCLC
jgi:hypothetical protein